MARSASPNEPGSRQSLPARAIPLMLVTMVVLVYAQVYSFDFINYDDTLYVTARTAVYRVRLTESEILLDSKRNVRITWRSVSNKSYRIYQSSDAVVWTLAAEDVPSADGLATSWTDPTKPLLSSEILRRYYKVIESE